MENVYKKGVISTFTGVLTERKGGLNLCSFSFGEGRVANLRPKLQIFKKIFHNNCILYCFFFYLCKINFNDTFNKEFLI